MKTYNSLLTPSITAQTIIAFIQKKGLCVLRVHLCFLSLLILLQPCVSSTVFAEELVNSGEEGDACRDAMELVVQGSKATTDEEREKLYSEALTKCPKLAEARYNRALLYRTQGKRELALSDLTQALELRDDDRFRVARGRILLELDRRDDARADFRAVLNRASGDVGAILGIADILGKEKEWSEAVRVLESGVVSEPNSALLRLNLGILYEMSGRPHEASEQYSKATQLDSSQGESWFRLALLDIGRGEEDNAIHRLERGVAVGGDTESVARVALARVYRKRKSLDKAELTIRRGLEKLKEDSQLLAELVAILYEQGRYSQVIEVAERALISLDTNRSDKKNQIDSTNFADSASSTVLIFKGSSERKLGKLDAAELSLKGSLSRNDKEISLHNELSLLYKDMGRADESAKHSTIAKKLREEGI